MDVQQIADRLVAWPSETGSPGEAAFADRVRELLLELPYFSAHPDHIALIDSHGTPPARCVAALVRGAGRRCVALAGHYDTVATRDYGPLAPIARDPEALQAALLAEFATGARNDNERRAYADLAGGGYRLGRGMLDMKSGDAAGIAVLERFSRTPDADGNVLLLLTPDEENRSRGMRAMRDALPALARRWGLEIVAGINLDAVSDLGDGNEGRSVHYGTVGKLLPFAYVVGRPAHAGYPFDGVSAQLIAAEIVRGIEANTALCDAAHGAWAPPPVCLQAGDLREGYDVTTPGAVWLAFNWLTHAAPPDAVLRQFSAVVETAMQAALAVLDARGREFHRRIGVEHRLFPTGTVLDFATLATMARERGGAAAAARHERLLASLAGEENPLAASRALVADLAAAARVEGPAVVVGFASLHYPHTHVGPEHAAIVAAIEAATAASAAAHGTTIVRREYFAGISDMSFFGVRPDPAAAACLAANTPAPAYVDAGGAEALCFPVVNIGPWGREYHQRLERVATQYAFRVLPDLLLSVARGILAVA